MYTKTLHHTQKHYTPGKQDSILRYAPSTADVGRGIRLLELEALRLLISQRLWDWLQRLRLSKEDCFEFKWLWIKVGVCLFNICNRILKLRVPGGQEYVSIYFFLQKICFFWLCGFFCPLNLPKHLSFLGDERVNILLGGRALNFRPAGKMANKKGDSLWCTSKLVS